MQTFYRRKAEKDYYTIKAGHQYVTSGEREGKVTVFDCRRPGYRVPVDIFEEECVETRLEQEHEIELRELREKVYRLEAYCEQYAEMTGITLNVSDEMRGAFMEATRDKD